MLKKDNILYFLFPSILILSFIFLVSRNKIIGSYDLLFQMIPPFNQGNLSYALNHFYIDQPLLFWPWMDSLRSSLIVSDYVGYSHLIGFGVEFPYHSNFAPLSIFINFYRFSSSEFMLTLVFFLQILICYFGCILVSKHYSTNATIGILLSVAFSLNSLFISWINHLFILGPFCFLPLMYFVYIKSFNKPRYLYLNLPIIIFSLFSGSIQTTLIVGIFILIVISAYRNQINSEYIKNFLILKFVVIIMISPFYLDFIVGFLENLSNESGRQLDLFSQYNIVNIFKRILFVPISQFPFILGSFNSFDLSKFFNVLYGIPHIPYIGSSILLTIICMKKIEKLFFIVPLLIYLSPLKSIVYERIFIILLFGIFLMAIRVDNKTEINLLNLKRLTIFLYISTGIWMLGSLFYLTKTGGNVIKNTILNNIGGAYFPLEDYPEFYEERFLSIGSDFSLFSWKNFLILSSIFLTIRYLKSREFKKVYFINLFQLVIYIIFHLSFPLSNDNVRQQFDNSFLSLNEINSYSRVIVLDNNNHLFLKENVLALYEINDVDYTSDIFRSKIKKINKELFNEEEIKKLDIDYIISEKSIYEKNFKLIYDEGSFLIYKNVSNEKRHYKFINQNKIEISCTEDLDIEIPINYSNKWKNKGNLKISENSFGGLVIECNKNGLFTLDYLPRFYKFQPHSLNYNVIILLITASLFFIKKEKNEN